MTQTNSWCLMTYGDCVWRCAWDNSSWPTSEEMWFFNWVGQMYRQYKSQFDHIKRTPQGSKTPACLYHEVLQPVCFDKKLLKNFTCLIIKQCKMHALITNTNTKSSISSAGYHDIMIYVDSTHGFWNIDFGLQYLQLLIMQPFYPRLIPQRLISTLLCHMSIKRLVRLYNVT